MDNLFSIVRNGNNGGRILWTDEQRAYIAEQYNLYHSIPTIAKQFGCCGEAIRVVLRKMNVKILSLSELKMKEYPRNSDFFENIDTKEKAYWLGFLYADGCLSNKNRIAINLSSVDEEHLYKFKKAIQYEKDIIGHSQKEMGEKKFFQSYFCFRDSKMYADLIDKGCIPNKSFYLKFPYDKVPEHLYSHFIRGFIDGDGCITHTQGGRAKKPNWKLSCVGTEDMLRNILKILGKENLALEKCCHNKEGKIYYKFTINGNKQLQRIFAYIYQDSNDDIELSRKRQKYSEFLLQVMNGESTNVECE